MDTKIISAAVAVLVIIAGTLVVMQLQTPPSVAVPGGAPAAVGPQSIGTTELKDGAVTADKLALEVRNLLLATGAVITTYVADDAITAPKIAAGAVGTSEIADGSITGADLADSIITTAKIVTSAVTSDKLADNIAVDNLYADNVYVGATGRLYVDNIRPRSTGTSISTAIDNLRVENLEVTGGRLTVWPADNLDNNIKGINVGLISVDPPNIGGGGSGTITVEILGANGDLIFLTPPSTFESGLVFLGATFTSQDIVTIAFANRSVAAVDGAARVWSYLAIDVT